MAAEGGLEALAAELVRHYRAVGHGAVPPALIEAIGALFRLHYVHTAQIGWEWQLRRRPGHRAARAQRGHRCIVVAAIVCAGEPASSS